MSNYIPGNQKHLTLNDRLYIENELAKGTLIQISFASLGKSESTVIDALRMFELQNLLQCKKMTKPYRYQLLVDPDKYPSLFVENSGLIRVKATPKRINSEKNL